MSILLLTTTVYVQNKYGLREINPTERIESYTKSLSQWLSKTNLKIVVIENSGYSFPEWREWEEKYGDRLEIITFRENEEAKYLEYDRSKGASEIFAIHYAYLHSKWIQSSLFLIKVTGRFFIPDLESFIKDTEWNDYDGLMQNNKETFRCQLIGVHLSQFDKIFRPNVINKNGDYDGHVENIYSERMGMFDSERILRCPLFGIEPTMAGGGDEVFYYI
jgi:hypothetical protein